MEDLMATPTAPAAAPYQKMSRVREAPSVTFAESIGISSLSSTTTTTTTTTSTTAVTLDRPWLRPLALLGFTAVSLAGVFLLVIDVLTPRKRVVLLGKEFILITKIAAPYLLEASYLSIVAVTTLLCGVSGLTGLFGHFSLLEAIGYILSCALSIFCGINALVEIIIGIYVSATGLAYKKNLAIFSGISDDATPTNPLAAALAEILNMADGPNSDAATRAIAATALHFWLTFWFTFFSGILWALGDSLMRLAFVVDGRNVFWTTALRRTGKGGRVLKTSRDLITDSANREEQSGRDGLPKF